MVLALPSVNRSHSAGSDYLALPTAVSFELNYWSPNCFAFEGGCLHVYSKGCSSTSYYTFQPAALNNLKCSSRCRRWWKRQRKLNLSTAELRILYCSLCFWAVENLILYIDLLFDKCYSSTWQHHVHEQFLVEYHPRFCTFVLSLYLQNPALFEICEAMHFDLCRFL